MSAAKRSSSIPWLPLLASAVVVPLLLTVVATLTGLGKRGDIEKDLGERGQAALQAAGVSGAALSFEGRDATLAGVGADKLPQAKKALEDVSGVRVVKAIDAQPAPSPEPAQPTTEATEEEASPAEDLQRDLKKLLEDNPITFEPDSAVLTSDGEGTVAKAAELLAGNPDAKARVEGHVADDGRGEMASGKKLSEDRASAVEKALTEQGVAPENLSSKGFGTSRPIADNNTPNGQAANRRVDIVVR